MRSRLVFEKDLGKKSEGLVLQGSELKGEKLLVRSLQEGLFGCGEPLSKTVCKLAGLSLGMRGVDLSEEQFLRLSDVLSSMPTGSALRKLMESDLAKIGMRRDKRAARLLRGLPVRGQGTKSNARTSRRSEARKTIVALISS